MFGSHRLNPTEAAEIIERFLNDSQNYPQEWNDFVDSKRGEPNVEVFRKRCDHLDPLVNCPGPRDEKALAELREIAMKLRALAASQVKEDTYVR
jgi:hypothetical protein